MKIICPRQNNRALTRTEVIVMVAVVGLAVLILFRNHSSTDSQFPKEEAQEMICVNHLHDILISFHVWASDHNDKFPGQASVTNGGVMELGDDVAAWKTFQVMSNSLTNPFVLFCPADEKLYPTATNFFPTHKTSYFASRNADWNSPEMILCGDDNFEINGSPVKFGAVEVTSNITVGWNTERHFYATPKLWFWQNRSAYGNIGFTDGSVDTSHNDRLQKQIRESGSFTNRLAIP